LLTKPHPIVVLGLDKDGHPRAATFSGTDLVPATKAASVMNLQIGRAESPEAIALVKQLPLGRVFATGKGLMPRAKRELYEKLLKVLKLEDPKPSAVVATEPALETGQKPPSTAAATEKTETNPGRAAPFAPWSWIEVGATVLWCADPKEGWFPCVVTAASTNGKLTLKWLDFPNFKPFEVKRLAVGLLCITP
jgi:hypothetical protein